MENFRLDTDKDVKEFLEVLKSPEIRSYIEYDINNWLTSSYMAERKEKELLIELIRENSNAEIIENLEIVELRELVRGINIIKSIKCYNK